MSGKSKRSKVEGRKVKARSKKQEARKSRNLTLKKFVVAFTKSGVKPWSDSGEVNSVFVIARSDSDEAISDWWGSSSFHLVSKLSSLLVQFTEIAALRFATFAMTTFFCVIAVTKSGVKPWRHDEAISGWWDSSSSHFCSRPIVFQLIALEIAALHCVPLAITRRNLQPPTFNLQPPSIFNLQSSIFNSPYVT